MDTTRINKIGRLLQKELSMILLQEAPLHYEGAMISVTQVRVTPDLSIARVHISIYPTDKTKSVFASIKNSSGLVRSKLGQKTGKQLRRVPDLQFFVDDSLDMVERIEELLKM